MLDRVPTRTSFNAWLTSDDPASRRQAWAGQLWRQWLLLTRNRLAMVGLAIVILLVTAALLAPWLTVHDPLAQNLANRLKPPSATHWFGTDSLGRDIFARIIYGARVTLKIVSLTILLVGPIGLAVGITAGYIGGIVDKILIRITDVFLAFPRLVLALAFVAVLGPGIENAVLAIALTGWPPYARVARAETQVIRNADYIAAVRLQGAGTGRILFKHVLPLCLPSLIVRTTLDMAGIILTAAGLGFLGLGAQPPTPEWGAMLADTRDLMLSHPWVMAFPGLCILVTVMAINLMGDGLRDALDPRLRKS